MAFLAVPLTTLAVSTLEPKDIPQGAALNNMMRQLGGSFGIAISTVFLNTRLAMHRNMMVEHISNFNDAFTQKYNIIYHGFLAKGFSVNQAQAMALKAIDGTMMKQVLLLSYNDVYLFVGAFLLCCIPLLYLQKFKRNAAVPSGGH